LSHISVEGRVSVKLEKVNREESEPQEFSYLPTTSFSQHQHYGRALVSISIMVGFPSASALWYRYGSSQNQNNGRAPVSTIIMAGV
jgi:hypothetical protein